jgi:hypothetical protein
MPYFYNALVVYAVAFILSILLMSVALLKFMGNVKKSIFRGFGIYVILFFTCVLMCNFLAFNLQIRIASPYIT